MSLSITIITPSFNQGEFIERTIKSVLSQDIADLEYLVIDGGSQDKTLDYLKKYESSLSWFSEPDSGQAHAVNKGFLRAKGEIIGWLNSDDIYCPAALKTVLEYFAANPDVDVIYGRGSFIDQDDREIGSYPIEKWNYRRLKQRCYISQPTVFFRRKVISRHGLLNEDLKYCMDYEYWLRLASEGVRFTFLPQVLAATRIHKNAKTRQAAVAAHEESIKMIRDYVKIIPTYRILSYAYALSRGANDQNLFRFISLLPLFVKEAFRHNRWTGIWNCFAMPVVFLRLLGPKILDRFLMGDKPSFAPHD